MAESFENLDRIKHDWAKVKYKKKLSRHWTGTRKWHLEKVLRKWLRKNIEAVGSRARLSQAQNLSW